MFGTSTAIANYISPKDLEEQVRFIPERVSSIEMMRNASTVLICSKNEALGRVTLEALAAGRIVIGSDSGGTRALLADARGILYDGSTQDLTAKLDNLPAEVTALAPADEQTVCGYYIFGGK